MTLQSPIRVLDTNQKHRQVARTLAAKCRVVVQADTDFVLSIRTLPLIHRQVLQERKLPVTHRVLVALVFANLC